MIQTFPECEAQATVSVLSKDSFKQNYKSEYSKKEKEEEKLAKTKEFMEDNDENVEKREVDVVNVNRPGVFKMFKKVPKCMEDEEIEARMDSNVNHI